MLSKEKLEHKKVELNKAQVIIAGGRGVSNMFSTLKELAYLVGGEVAASRAVVDSNIEQKDSWLAKQVQPWHPKVYLASGIVGRSSTSVVWINQKLIIRRLTQIQMH